MVGMKGVKCEYSLTPANKIDCSQLWQKQWGRGNGAPPPPHSPLTERSEIFLAFQQTRRKNRCWSVAKLVLFFFFGIVLLVLIVFCLVVHVVV